MKAHFVIFESPGTFVSQETEKPIESWNVELAQQMAHSIVERHGATPYAFYFTTRERTEKELDSRVTNRSGYYYLGGQIKTLKQLEAMKDPSNEILIENMKGNGWDRVLFNGNSYRIVRPFTNGDVLLNWKPKTKKQ